MGAELTGYTAASGAVDGLRPQHLSGARGTDTVQWRRSGVPTWTDLPSASREADSGRGQPIAEAVEDHRGMAQKVDGNQYQVRTAWRAYVDRVVVVRAGRPLARRLDGKMHTVGDWVHLSSDTYQVATAPTRTEGLVQAGVVNDETRAAAAVQAAALPRDQRDAADTFAYLPPQVRASALRAVPQATVWSATLIQMYRGDLPNSQILSMLRLSDTGAVVIRASRELPNSSRSQEAADRTLASTPWAVTQVVYDFFDGTAGPAQISKTAKRFQIGRR